MSIIQKLIVPAFLNIHGNGYKVLRVHRVNKVLKELMEQMVKHHICILSTQMMVAKHLQLATEKLLALILVLAQITIVETLRLLVPILGLKLRVNKVLKE